MQLAEPILASWKAELRLEFERREGRTVLAKRRHDGPLVVQKPLYPEGGAVCHAILVHPPAGIAGGDELEFSACAGEGAHALLTTPGAGKWYRSGGAWARQRLDLHRRRRLPRVVAAGNDHVRRRARGHADRGAPCRRSTLHRLGDSVPRPQWFRGTLRPRCVPAADFAPAGRKGAVVRARTHRRRQPPARIAGRPDGRAGVRNAARRGARSGCAPSPLPRGAAGERRRGGDAAAGCAGGALPRLVERVREALLHATVARSASGGSGTRGGRAAYLEHVNGIDAT